MAYHTVDSTTFETFFASQYDCDEWNNAEGLRENLGDSLYTPGYYFWFTLPGCLPDSEAFGPYSTEERAYDAAVEWLS